MRQGQGKSGRFPNRFKDLATALPEKRRTTKHMKKEGDT
jgi:hypothetical protein